MRYNLVYLSILLTGFQAFCQDAEPHNTVTLQYNQLAGRIIKHSKNFEPAISENSYLYETKISKVLNGKKLWHRTHNAPAVSFSFIYANYGNSNVFGDSFNALVGLNYYKQKQKFIRHLNLKFGLNYSTKPFNRITNPTNNVIGSKLNLTAKIGFGYEYKISKRLGVLVMTSIMHHSNGRAEIPNLGVNVLGLQVGFKWNSLQKPSFNPNLKNVLIDKAHQFNISLGYARHESDKELNGPKYPVYTISAFANKRLNFLVHLSYGVEYNYFTSVYQNLIDNRAVGKNFHWHASRVAPYIGVDFLYGRFAISTLVGFYPYRPISIGVRIPTKLGFKYYLHSLDVFKQHNCFVAGYLKTHYAVAEYLEISFGYSFKRKSKN